MDHLDSMLLNNFLQVKLSYQIAAQCTIYRPCFQIFSPVPKYRFKYRHNAPFTVPVSIYFLHFQIV